MAPFYDSLWLSSWQYPGEIGIGRGIDIESSHTHAWALSDFRTVYRLFKGTLA